MIITKSFDLSTPEYAGWNCIGPGSTNSREMNPRCAAAA
jgi:hypothetical protein